MQGAKKAGETIKETTANIGASAKSGLEKTKAAVQEKVFLESDLKRVLFFYKTINKFYRCNINLKKFLYYLYVILLIFIRGRHLFAKYHTLLYCI
jgi:hypothetical protein